MIETVLEDFPCEMKKIEGKVKLDNRVDLCQKYLHNDQCTSTMLECDRDLLLACYRQSGEEIVHDLIGTFAFAIWDESKKYYWCARDQLGQAAFYYTFLDGDFISTSSLTQLLELLPHKPKPNITSMKEFAWYGSGINPEHTMYEGIFRLPPGHQMTVKDGKAEISRYWDPKSIKVDHSITLDESAETFLALFREAVSCRLTKDKPTGCELSGGLDSSSIFCVGKEQGAEMQAFSMRYGEMLCDESSYIDEVLEHTGEQGISVATDRLDYKDRYSPNAYYTLMPHWPLWTTSLSQLPLLEAMDKNGIRTVLSGHGGDQVLIGTQMLCFDYLQELKLRDFWREYRVLCTLRKPLLDRYVKALFHRVLPPVLIKGLKYLLPSRYRLEAPLPKSYKNYTDTYPYVDSFVQKDLLQVVTGASHFGFMDMTIYRVAEEHYGIDFYHPFFDLRVVEFLLSVPPEFKYSEQKIRQLHRRAMVGILPEGVRTRIKKATLGDIIMQYMEAVDLDDFWREPHIVRLGIITQKTLDDIHAEYQSNSSGYRRSVSRYWRLINLEQWYRFNYDSDRV